MAWDDIREDERELLRDVDYDARHAHYGATSRALLFFIIVVLVFLITMLFGFWYVFTRMSIAI